MVQGMKKILDFRPNPPEGIDGSGHLFSILLQLFVPAGQKKNHPCRVRGFPWFHRRSVQRPDLNRDGTSDHWVYPEAGDVPKLVGNHLKWNKVDMIDRCFETMQATLAKYKSAGYDADVEINIDSSSCGSQEFFRAQELIKVGRTATLQALQFESLV